MNEKFLKARIPHDLYEALQARAAIEGLRLSTYVREALARDTQAISVDHTYRVCTSATPSARCTCLGLDRRPRNAARTVGGAPACTRVGHGQQRTNTGARCRTA